MRLPDRCRGREAHSLNSLGMCMYCGEGVFAATLVGERFVLTGFEGGSLTSKRVEIAADAIESVTVFPDSLSIRSRSGGVHNFALASCLDQPVRVAEFLSLRGEA